MSRRHPFHWRDAMDVVVRWRQVAEPNDAVLWVDLLSKEEFENGFGSHTPLFTGQTKCVRYYGQFDRAFQLFKDLTLQRGHTFVRRRRSTHAISTPLALPLSASFTPEWRLCVPQTNDLFGWNKCAVFFYTYRTL